MTDTERGDELAAFVRNAVAATGAGRFAETRPLDAPPPEDDADDGADEYESVGDESSPEPSRGVSPDAAAAAVSREAMADFLETLAPDEYQRAMADPEFASAGFAQFLADSTDAATARKLHRAWLQSGDEADPSGEELVSDAVAPTSGAAIIRAVLDGTFEVDDPISWSIWATSASPDEWSAAAEAAGWDPKVRPRPADLPQSVETERIRRWVARDRDDIAAGRRRPWG
jgi:hypothetical protein